MVFHSVLSLGRPQIHSLAAETPQIVQMDVYSHAQARLMGASRAWEFTFHGFLSPQTCFLAWIFFSIQETAECLLRGRKTPPAAEVLLSAALLA